MYREELILSALRRRDLWNRYRKVLKPGYFSQSESRRIYAKLDALHRGPGDWQELPLSLFDANLPPLPPEAELGTILADFMVRARLHETAKAAHTLAAKPGLLTETDLAAVTREAETVIADDEIEKRIVRDLDPETRRYATGIRFLDWALSGGVAPGELLIVGAPPHTGKTHWLVKLGASYAAQGMPTYHFILEDRPNDLVTFYSQAVSRYPSDVQDRVWQNVTLLNYNDTAPSIQDLRAAVRYFVGRSRPRRPICVVVDYADLMRGDGDEVRHRITSTLRDLRQMGNEFNALMLTGRQNDAAAWTKEWGDLSNFSESKIGSAATADVVLMFSQLPEEKETGEARLTLAKAKGRRMKKAFFHVRVDWETFEIESDDDGNAAMAAADRTPVPEVLQGAARGDAQGSRGTAAGSAAGGQGDHQRVDEARDPDGGGRDAGFLVGALGRDDAVLRGGSLEQGGQRGDERLDVSEPPGPGPDDDLRPGDEPGGPGAQGGSPSDVTESPVAPPSLGGTGASAVVVGAPQVPTSPLP